MARTSRQRKRETLARKLGDGSVMAKRIFLSSPHMSREGYELEYIRDADFGKLEDTTYEVEGRDLFFFIQSYETKENNETPESHLKYIDIQYMIFGTEVMGVGHLDTMTEEVEAKPQNDIWFHRGPMDFITVSEGMFAVFFPNDAHAPCITHDGTCSSVRKAVFKVKVG